MSKRWMKVKKSQKKIELASTEECEKKKKKKLCWRECQIHASGDYWSLSLTRSPREAKMLKRETYSLRYALLTPAIKIPAWALIWSAQV